MKPTTINPLVLFWDGTPVNTVLVGTLQEDYGHMTVSDFDLLANLAGKYPWLIRLECEGLDD
jgi:hypothetical protein